MKREKTGSPVKYKLELSATVDATGYFSCKPKEDYAFQDIIDHLRLAPFDEFMHNLLLRRISAFPREKQAALYREAMSGKDSLLFAACLEAGIENDALSPSIKKGDLLQPDKYAQITPLITLKAKAIKDRSLHQKWIARFRDNMLHHTPMPRKSDLPPPHDPDMLAGSFGGAADIAAIHDRCKKGKKQETSPLPSSAETARKALAILEDIGILSGGEMRHESSLSPYALLRRWQLDRRVLSGRHHYRLSGTQTSYGRGLDIEAARASNLMEIIERYSSFAGINRNNVEDYTAGHQLIHGSFSSLKKEGVAMLDPNLIRLEAPYQDEAIYWLAGETTLQGKTAQIWVPAQTVFPFCNLDEPCLFSGLGSTGLASGNTMAQAKAASLLEIIERDAEAVMPFVHSRCFRAESGIPEIAALFNGYQERGIDVAFQDLTSGFGIPCCKCFVRAQDGTLSKGVGAHLDAKRALLSALTETPYPFPGGAPSLQAPDNLMVVPLENLPDYTGGNPETDLAVLEEVLEGFNYQAIYVDLTRKDTGTPVVRTIVPGLEIMADFDEFSRVSPRLFHNYLALCKQV